jgi:hypothetical protein
MIMAIGIGIDEFLFLDAAKTDLTERFAKSYRRFVQARAQVK